VEAAAKELLQVSLVCLVRKRELKAIHAQELGDLRTRSGVSVVDRVGENLKMLAVAEKEIMEVRGQSSR